MGVCCSKRGEPSFAAKVPSKDPPKEKSAVKEENESSEAAEFVKAAASLTTKNVSCTAEAKNKKTGDTPVKQSAKLVEEKDSKAAATVTTPLRTSSCTKEEVDAILIQCGRLSRNSSSKTSNEMAGQRKHSGSNKSYDFDNDGKEEGEAFDKSISRPSPRRRTRSGSRERGSGEGRRVSRSPGRRSDDPASFTCDKARQQPAKMISVPATEKVALFVNGNTESGSSVAKRVSAAAQSTRSRSPANKTRLSNENAQSQSLSRCSSRKADESPSGRNPMAEIDEDSLRNHNGGNTSREVDDKAIQSLFIHENKAEIVEEAVDAKLNTGVESLNPLTLTRTRSSRRTSRDLDNNPILKPTSNASFMLEDTAFSFPTRVSKACSMPEAVNDLNSSCSEQRSNEADQSNNNSFLKGGLVRRVSMVQRETLTESEQEVKDDQMKPRESAGSNSFIGELWASSWDLNSVDSTDRCRASLPCNAKEVKVEDEVSQTGNQQQKRSWHVSGSGQRSRASS